MDDQIACISMRFSIEEMALNEANSNGSNSSTKDMQAPVHWTLFKWVQTKRPNFDENEKDPFESKEMC